MPYSDYAVAHDVPALLEEAEALILSATEAGIPAVHLGHLSVLLCEGTGMAQDDNATPDAWIDFTARLDGALIAFEREIVLPLLEAQEAPDVAAIA